MTYEIGSNSDLVLENQVTGNLTWTIPAFAEKGRGFLTFPTKFADVGPLLGLRHEGKTIFRMSVNPQPVISHIELGTAPLEQRVEALNQMRRAGYPWRHPHRAGDPDGWVGSAIWRAHRVSGRHAGAGNQARADGGNYPDDLQLCPSCHQQRGVSAKPPICTIKSA